jgi:phosphatidylglycerol:prolipoprotein diacylglycerol transferase
MHPTICTIGPLTVYSYGLMLVIAFLIASHLASRQARVEGIDPEFVLSVCFRSFIAGIIGARVLFVISHAGHYLENPLEILRLTQGGLSVFGGLIAGIVTAFAVVRSRRLSWRRVLDLLLPFAALGQAIGRVGCYLNGCCYGKEAVWGVVFPGEPHARIPTQLIASFLLVCIFVLLRLLQDRPHAAGSIACWYFILYGAKRFFVESLRADNALIFDGMTLYHVMSAGCIVIGIVSLMRMRVSKVHTRPYPLSGTSRNGQCAPVRKGRRSKE